MIQNLLLMIALGIGISGNSVQYVGESKVKEVVSVIGVVAQDLKKEPFAYYIEPGGIFIGTISPCGKVGKGLDITVKRFIPTIGQNKKVELKEHFRKYINDHIKLFKSNNFEYIVVSFGDKVALEIKVM